MAVIPMLSYEDGFPERLRDVPDVRVRHYRVEGREGHRWMFSQDLPQ